MNPFRSFKAVALGAVFFGLAAFAFGDVSTVPVGYMSFKIAGGAPGAPVSTSFAIPLIDPPSAEGVSEGRIAALTANTIKITNAGWTAGKLAAKRAPYAVRIKSGAKAGLTLVITGNTTDTLTVDSATSLTDLGLKQGASGTPVQLIPIDTLDSLFGDDTLIGGTSPANADVVYLGVKKQTGYLYNTTLGYWTTTNGSTINRNFLQIPPHAAIRIDRVGPETTLYFTGRVPETAFVVDVANSGDTHTHAGFPVNITLGALALQTKIPGWVSAKKPANADTISIATGDSWRTYFHTGTKWQSTTGSTTARDSVVIKAGVPIRITRIGTAKGTTALTVPRPYTLD